jgi:Flp pilus assembly pilin Flp
MRKGTSILEYGVILIIAAAAILAVAVLMKRAISSKYQEVGTNFGSGRQYKP